MLAKSRMRIVGVIVMTKGEVDGHPGLGTNVLPYQVVRYDIPFPSL